MATVINLDHNATTPLLPAAAEAMRRVEIDAPGNPSSAHALGRKARQHLEDARERVARCLDCHVDEVIFTSGATEANNLALFGLATGNAGHILANPTEHPCVIEPLNLLAKRGWVVEWLPVLHQGFIDPSEVRSRVRPETRLIVVQRANHETGTLLWVESYAPLGPPLHCDAAQAVGKVPVSFRRFGATTMSVSAHKFRGPMGIGALIVKHGTTLAAQLFGGHQQRGLRPGTEPVALAVGMATALEHAVNVMNETVPRVRQLRDVLYEKLVATASPVVWNGDEEAVECLPNTLNVSFPGCRGDLLMMALDLAGVACSTGSACSSGSLLPSPVLKAMRVPDDVLRGAVRFSLGEETTAAEIDIAAERIAACVRRVRAPH